MPKSPNKMVVAVVAGMKDKTGKKAELWVEFLKKDGPEGYTNRVKWLKTEHRLGHVQASIVAQFLKHGGNLHADGNRLINDLFSGKNASLRPLIDRLSAEITGLGAT